MINPAFVIYNPRYAAGRQKNPTAFDEDVCSHLWLLPVQSDNGIAVFVNHVLCIFLALLLNGVEMASNVLVHSEHVDLGLLEHSLHLLVAADLALVCGILEIVGLDVLPQLLDDLRTGKLLLYPR